MALPNESGSVTVGWRLLADPPGVTFHVYRRDLYAEGGYVRVTASPLADATTFTDAAVRQGSS